MSEHADKSTGKVARDEVVGILDGVISSVERGMP